MLDEYHKAILKALFFGAANMYHLEKATGLKHATCHKKVQELLKFGLITVDKQERFKTGLLKRQFKLTKEGYLEAFKIIDINDKKVQQKLSELASQEPPLHPILPLWPAIQKLGHDAQHYFQFMLKDFEIYFPLFMQMLLQQEQEPYPLPIRTENGEPVMFKPLQILSNEQQKFLVDEIKKRKDLYKLLMEKIERNIKEYEAQLENLRKIRELLL